MALPTSPMVVKDDELYILQKLIPRATIIYIHTHDTLKRRAFYGMHLRHNHKHLLTSSTVFVRGS